MVPRRRIGVDVRIILHTILTGWDSNGLRSDRRDLCGKRARRTIQPLWSSDWGSDYRGRRESANWWRNKRLWQRGSRLPKRDPTSADDSYITRVSSRSCLSSMDEGCDENPKNFRSTARWDPKIV